ncbi:hypothetical protein ACCO45_005992 [Purpureocillium lilacinum]|uniref:Uncharacterized protein n=1 Tax=Purpureocillium lilacinum TaxID=33203 RepID=A0ACC4DZT1_PURLI
MARHGAPFSTWPRPHRTGSASVRPFCGFDLDTCQGQSVLDGQLQTERLGSRSAHHHQHHRQGCAGREAPQRLAVRRVSPRPTPGPRRATLPRMTQCACPWASELLPSVLKLGRGIQASPVGERPGTKHHLQPAPATRLLPATFVLWCLSVRPGIRNCRRPSPCQRAAPARYMLACILPSARARARARASPSATPRPEAPRRNPNLRGRSKDPVSAAKPAQTRHG